MMRVYAIVLLLMFGNLSPAAAALPTITLNEALNVAEDYLEQNKIDTSKYYLTSVGIKSGTAGELYWDAQWMATDPMVKGDWFIVRVQMDKTVVLLPGK